MDDDNVALLLGASIRAKEGDEDRLRLKALVKLHFFDGVLIGGEDKEGDLLASWTSEASRKLSVDGTFSERDR